jgi:hypothetical protein
MNRKVIIKNYLSASQTRNVTPDVEAGKIENA